MTLEAMIYALRNVPLAQYNELKRELLEVDEATARAAFAVVDHSSTGG